MAIVAAYETLLDRDKRAAYDVELGARSETLQDTLRRARMRREARAREADSARDEGAETGDPLADFVQSFRCACRPPAPPRGLTHRWPGTADIAAP